MIFLNKKFSRVSKLKLKPIIVSQIDGCKSSLKIRGVEEYLNSQPCFQKVKAPQTDKIHRDLCDLGTWNACFHFFHSSFHNHTLSLSLLLITHSLLSTFLYSHFFSCMIAAPISLQWRLFHLVPLLVLIPLISELIFCRIANPEFLDW